MHRTCSGVFPLQVAATDSEVEDGLSGLAGACVMFCCRSCDERCVSHLAMHVVFDLVRMSVFI